MNIFNPQTWLSIIEKIIILAATLVAGIKFKVFNLWEEDYRTEIEVNCHRDKELVWADYTIANIGDRPFIVGCVRLDLCKAKEEKEGHLVPSDSDLDLLVPSTFSARDVELATSIGKFDPKKHFFKKLGTIGYLRKGERTIIALCCHRKEPLPEYFFLVAEWWRRPRFSIGRYKHSFFKHMHVQTVAGDQSFTRSKS